MIQSYYLAVFNSTHHAIKFEKVLKESGLKVDLIPVPRELVASCGLAAMFNSNNIDSLKQLIDTNNLSVAAIYLVKKEENKRSYLKL